MTSDGAFINDTSDQMSECDKQEASALLDGGKDPYLPQNKDKCQSSLKKFV